MSYYIKDLLRYAWQLLSGFRGKHELWLSDSRKRDIDELSGKVAWTSVLDLANGRLRPQYLILKSAGYNVIGIDLVNRRTTPLIDLAYSWSRIIYLWTLGSTYNLGSGSALVCGDAARLPFANSSFTLVTSIAAFEHLREVPGVLEELQRVMKPGGLLWACIHLFTSPSGAHNLNISQVPLRSFPRGVDAWDHLRRQRIPIRADLNRWRLQQYLDAFSDRFEILRQYCVLREGEHLLTPEIGKELSNYRNDELTCAAYVIVARKT